MAYTVVMILVLMLVQEFHHCTAGSIWGSEIIFNLWSKLFCILGHVGFHIEVLHIPLLSFTITRRPHIMVADHQYE